MAGRGYVVGADVGSQSVKALLLDADGRVLAHAGSALSLVHPRPAWAEQDPQDWERALAEAVRQVLAAAGVAPGEVAALCLACQVDGVVPVDRAGAPLGPAIIWLDRRAEAQVEQLVARVGAERAFAITGLLADPSHTGPKIMWLRAERPEVFAAAAAFLPVAAYLLRRFTGVLALDHANASSSLLYDVTSRDWSPPLLEAAELTRAQLGEIRPATDAAGPLRADAASRLGLTDGCQMLVGTGDDHAGALGAGLVGPGLIADVTGTAEPVATCAAEPVFDPDGLVETHLHAVPGQYLVENPGFVSGGSTLWLAEQVLRIPQGDVLAIASDAPPGAGGVLFVPALSGSMAPRWNGRMRGAFAGLSMASGPAELARAVVEGCCFALRDITDRFTELGLPGDEIRVVGGGARSPLWLQTKADVTGRPVRAVRVPEATALGAGLLAAVGAGLFSDLSEAVAAAVHLAADPVLPDTGRQADYAEAYPRYRRLFDGVEGALT